MRFAVWLLQVMQLSPAGGISRSCTLQPRAWPALSLQDMWVTGFGFGPSDLPLIIREFSKAGDIAQVATWGGKLGSGGSCKALPAAAAPEHTSQVLAAVA